MASLSEADVQRFVLEISDTEETKDTAKEEDPKVERVEPKNVNDKHENETYGDETMPKLIAHVADVAAEEQTKIKHSTCDECKSNKQEIMEIKAMLTEIKTNQMKDRENTITNEAESIAKINSLHEENNEMASEIAFLKATISELVRDNESIRKIFDLKQNKWVKMESKPSSSKTTPPDSIPTTSTGNRFETLIDENNENMSNAETHVNINAQIQDYRLKQQSNFECKKNNKQNKKEITPTVIRWSNTSIGRKSSWLQVASQLFILIVVQRWNKSMRRLKSIGLKMINMTQSFCTLAPTISCRKSQKR